jgi:outer membrane protein TolC
MNMRPTTASPIALFVALAALGASTSAKAQETPAAPATPSASAEPVPADSLEQRLRAMVGRPGGLGADEVGRRAAMNSPEVRAKQAELDAARADVDKALVGYFPRLTVTARYTRLSDITPPSFGPSSGNLVAAGAEGPLPPGTPLVGVPASALSFPVVLDQYLLQASLTVPVSDYLLRIGQTHSAAEHARGAARIRTKASRVGASANAKILYYAWARSRLQEEVARQNLAQAKSHLEAAKAGFDVDRVAKADVLRAESQVASSELLVERAKNLSKLTEDQLRTALRDPESRRYEIGEDLFAPPPGATEMPEFTSAYHEALRKRLELRALAETERALGKQKAAAKSSSYPRLDAFGNVYYANPNQRYFPQKAEWHASWDAGLQLTWTPNDAAASSAAQSALEAERAKVEAQKTALRDALRGEVFDAVQSVQEAKVAVETSRRGLEAAEEAYRGRAEAFRVGRASSIELTDSETELLRARLDMVNANTALRIARVKLEHALGRDVH